jgi:hypothetical protein
MVRRGMMGEERMKSLLFVLAIMFAFAAAPAPALASVTGCDLEGNEVGIGGPEFQCLDNEFKVTLTRPDGTIAGEQTFNSAEEAQAKFNDWKSWVDNGDHDGYTVTISIDYYVTGQYTPAMTYTRPNSPNN